MVTEMEYHIPAVELHMDELYSSEQVGLAPSSDAPTPNKDLTKSEKPGHQKNSLSMDSVHSHVSPEMAPSRSRSRARGGPRDPGGFFLPEYQPRGTSTPRKARRRKHKPVNMEQLTGVKSRMLAPGSTVEDDLESPRKMFFGSQVASNAASGANTPMMRPVSRAGGITILRQQLEALNLERQPSSTSTKQAGSKPGSESPSTIDEGMSDVGYDSDPTEMTSYEYSISFETDFVSSEARIAEKEDAHKTPQTPFIDTVHRKMTARDFEPLTCLGQGTFGTVHLVRQVPSGRLYAQKMFRKVSLTMHKSMIEQTKTERAILESINRHPFVVKLFYAFQDHERLYLILEYAQGGELFTHLAAEKMFPEDTASFYMAELVLALEHLHHTVGVVYRDLKPENCLLDADGHLLLTDFGLSKIAEDGADTVRCSSFLGTVDYMAPEVILGQFYHAPVDWWSLGALGFDLLAGKPPFAAGNHKKTQEKICRGKVVFPYFFGPDSKDLLTKLLRKEPAKRLGFNGKKDISKIKSHRFFRKIDWKKLEKRQMEPPIQPLVTDPALAENFSTEFTDMALSPTLNAAFDADAGPAGREDKEHPFRGFSFVAPRSFLEQEYMDRLKDLGRMEANEDVVVDMQY